MGYICKSFWFVVAFTFCSTTVLSQAGEITVKFIANAGLRLTDGASTLYFDFPYKSGFLMYSKYNKSEFKKAKNDSAIFVFTHKHPDHYSILRVMRLKGKVFGPRSAEELVLATSCIPEFSIQVFKTSHFRSFKHCSYLITWHGKKLFISGDTENADTIATIAKMDWAFVPAWLVGDAIKKKIKIDATMIGIYHIGPKDNITSDSPKIRLMATQGETISIPY